MCWARHRVCEEAPGLRAQGAVVPDPEREPTREFRVRALDNVNFEGPARRLSSSAGAASRRGSAAGAASRHGRRHTRHVTPCPVSTTTDAGPDGTESEETATRTNLSEETRGAESEVDVSNTNEKK